MFNEVKPIVVLPNEGIYFVCCEFNINNFYYILNKQINRKYSSHEIFLENKLNAISQIRFVYRDSIEQTKFAI